MKYIIYVASGNKHKIKEFEQILSPAGAEVRPYPDFEKLNVEETGDTFEANASIKAAALSNLAEHYVIADDSGIEVDSLNGAPGIYSARYSGANANDKKNNELLLKNLADKADRTARFVSAIALAKGGQIIKVFRGECEGSVGMEERGDNGFGYDPLFILPEGLTINGRNVAGLSMAELSPDEKNSISHRRRAAEKLFDYLNKL